MKKKQIIELLLLVVCCFVALSANAQQGVQRSDAPVPQKNVTPNLPLSQDALKDSLLKEVSHYPFIFEGTIRETYQFEDDKHEIWTSTLIEIHKSFKGNLQSGTVELMTKNIDIFADRHSPRQPLPPNPVQVDTTSDIPGQATSGVFFLDSLCYLPIIKIKKRNCDGRPLDIAISIDTNTSPTPKAVFAGKATNKIKLSCWGNTIWYNLAKNSRYEHNTSLGIGQISTANKYGEIAFEDTIEVYDFIKRIDNTNIINFTKKQFKRTDYKWQKKRNDSPLNFRTNINQEKQVILDRLNDINGTANKNLKIAFDNNLTYFFENEAYIKEGDNVFLEFDVYVQANNAETFLDNAILVFRYSNTAFGNNIDNNNNVEISRGFAISSTTNYANPFSYDVDANHFKVVVSVAPTVTNRFQLTSSPVQLCHLRLKKAECSVNSDLYFENLLTTQNTNHAIYTETPNEPYTGGTYYAYNNIDYSDMSLQHQMCKPEITEVTSDDTNYPNAVPAGCGRHLIIKGRFFGNEKGNIRFHNTSNSLATDQFLWLDNFDMSTCSWTNNEISVVLPNKSIDSYNSGGTTIYSFYTLHSDVFKVITSYSTFSDDKFLNIPYNLFNKCEQQSPNSVLAAAKYRYKLVANDAVHNTMNFRLHTNLFQSEEVMSVIYRALDKWQCATGIQYRITENFDDDIDASFVANEENNNISSIFYYEDLEFTGLANSYGDVCGNAVEIDEIDILLDINGDTPGGWEQTLLHELGHAHGLAHTLPDVADNIEDLMQPGPDLTQLITEIEGDDLQGALNVVNYSTENTVCGTMLSKMGQGTLQMKDSWCDLGIEPNFSCAHGTGDETWDDIWESPDLWNCQGTNDCTEPQAIKAGQTNRLRFNIRNPNNCTSDVPTIHLYWTVASTGEVWPEDWIHNNDNCMQGNEIGTLTLPALAPNETRIGSVNWVAPSLSTFSGCDANDINDLVGSKMEMCLLARLETPSDPIIREEQDVPVTINILNNNNIVTRNTVLEDIQYNQTGQASIIHIKNNNHFDTNLNLVIKGLVKLTLEEAQQLHIDIILTQSLWDRWTSTGAQGIGVQIIEPKVVRVTNLNTAKLLNIPMLADESRPFGVRIKRINNGKVESSPTDYKFGIIHEAFDPHIIINKSSGCVFNVHTKTNDIPISSNNLVLLAYPNPSDASLNLSFNLPNTEAVVSLYVYDMQGRLVNKVFEGNNVQNGVYSFDVKTEQLPRGIYMATLKTTQDRKSTKISIIK